MVTAKQQQVLDVLADGRPHRSIRFNSSAALALTKARKTRPALVETWLKRGPTPTGNYQRWFQKI